MPIEFYRHLSDDDLAAIIAYLRAQPAGLRDFTDTQISQSVRGRVDRSGRPYRPPMGFDFYKAITDADMAALITYLRSLKPQPFGGT